MKHMIALVERTCSELKLILSALMPFRVLKLTRSTLPFSIAGRNKTAVQVQRTCSGLKLMLSALRLLRVLKLMGSALSWLNEMSRKRSVVTLLRSGGSSCRRQQAMDSLDSCGAAATRGQRWQVVDRRESAESACVCRAAQVQRQLLQVAAGSGQLGVTKRQETEQ